MAPFHKSDAGMIRTAYDLSAGLLSFVVALALGYWIGRLVDGWLGTSPWATAIFALLGLAGGVLNVYGALTRALGQSAKPRDTSDRPERGR